MRTMHFLVIIFSLLLFISCKSGNSNEPESESYLSIKGITYMNELGELVGSIDHDDWVLNEKFTSKEKLLFDTLNFAKTATAEPIPNTGNSVYTPPHILFCPNPCATVGGLYYYHENHILNIIIVDNKYNKLLSYRTKDTQHPSFDLAKLNKGIYRLYYVIQDSQYNIVHLGHGDIEKE